MFSNAHAIHNQKKSIFTSSSKHLALHISSFPFSHRNSPNPKPKVPNPPRLLTLLPLKSTTGDNRNSSTSGYEENNTIIPVEEAAEIKLRRGQSRKRLQRRRLDQEALVSDELAIMEMEKLKKKKKMKKKKLKEAEESKPKPKSWEEMTITEKALELYLGEKGALFWLNKFAYASIFIIIGAWILFRFVGPALNLYQLDSPPLSPTSIFKER